MPRRKIEGTATAKGEASLSRRLWHSYPGDQAIAAATFSRMCGEIEDNPPPPSSDESARGLTCSEEALRQHRSFALASVFAAVAFLEASINELFASAADSRLQVGGSLPPTSREALTSAVAFTASLPLLDRYDLALLLLGQAAVDRGRQPFQNVALVVRLRNALVHYKPRWQPVGPDAARSKDEMREAFRDKNLKPSPFAGVDSPFFPDKCLGHGGTSWAWRSALNFADDFFTRVGVRPPYESQRAMLTP